MKYGAAYGCVRGRARGSFSFFSALVLLLTGLCTGLVRGLVRGLCRNGLCGMGGTASEGSFELRLRPWCEWCRMGQDAVRMMTGIPIRW